MNKLNFEHLETRAMLSGNVEAFFQNGDLHVVGDAGDNWVEIREVQFKNGSAIRVESGDGTTTINGTAGAYFLKASVDDVRVSLGDGDDHVYAHDVSFPRDLNIDLGLGGDGADVVNVITGDDLVIRTAHQFDPLHDSTDHLSVVGTQVGTPGIVNNDLIVTAEGANDRQYLNLYDVTVQDDIYADLSTSDYGLDEVQLHGVQALGESSGGVARFTAFKVQGSDLSVTGDVDLNRVGDVDLTGVSATDDIWVDGRDLGSTGDDIRITADSVGDDFRIRGHAGDDSVEVGGHFAVRVEGGSGNDTIGSGAGDDTLIGGVGNDDLYGRTGDDVLEGGSGHDGLFGGVDSDVLDGGTGNDRYLIDLGDPHVDAINGLADEDAKLTFIPGEEFSYGSWVWVEPGQWTDAEIEMMDRGFSEIVKLTDNTELLKKSPTDSNFNARTESQRQITFVRQGTRSRPNPEERGGIEQNFRNGGLNSSGTIRMFGSEFDPAREDSITSVMFHELGHNWDRQGENAYVGMFRAVAGWTEFAGDPGAGWERATDNDPNWENWFFEDVNDGLDRFTRAYGKTNPLEDFASTFEAYVMVRAGRTWPADPDVESRVTDPNATDRFDVLDWFFGSVSS